MNFSKRWSPDTKNLVSNSRINLITVYDNTDLTSDVLNILGSNHLQEAHHCDFCGQKIKYTSVLKLTKNSNVTHFQIGKECLIYMDDHDLHVEGYKEIKNYVTKIVKDLVEKNKSKRRRTKYADLHTDVLSWMKDHVEFVSKNRFLSDMYNILLTGKKVYSKNMDFYVKSAIEKYEQTEMAKRTNLVAKNDDVVRMKIEKVLYLISSAYNIKFDEHFKIINGSSNGDYMFVYSIYTYFLKYNSLSQKQSETLNNVYKRLSDRLKKSVVKSDPNVLLPF